MWVSEAPKYTRVSEVRAVFFFFVWLSLFFFRSIHVHVYSLLIYYTYLFIHLFLLLRDLCLFCISCVVLSLVAHVVSMCLVHSILSFIVHAVFCFCNKNINTKKKIHVSMKIVIIIYYDQHQYCSLWGDILGFHSFDSVYGHAAWIFKTKQC